MFKVTEKARKLARKIEFQDLEISIETDKGQVRHWTDEATGEKGTTKMHYPYGYFCGMKDKGWDGDQLDVFVGPHDDSPKVFVVDQLKKPEFKKLDEQKVMIGFCTAREAKAAYLMHFNTPKFFGSMKEYSIDDFKNKFVKKAFGDEEAPVETEQEAAPPALVMNVNDPMFVNQALMLIDSVDEAQLMPLAAEIWGDGYQYFPVTENHIRAEVKGFLEDQLDLFEQMSPMTMQSATFEDPDLLDHSDPQAGPEGVASLAEEDSKDGFQY